MMHGFIITSFTKDMDIKALPYTQQKLMDSLTDLPFIKDISFGVGRDEDLAEPVLICECKGPMGPMQKAKIDILARAWHQEYWICISFASATKRLTGSVSLGYYRQKYDWETPEQYTLDFHTGNIFMIDSLK